MNNPFTPFSSANPNGIVKSPKGTRFSRNGNKFFLSYQGSVTELDVPAKAFLREYYREAWYPTLKNDAISFATPSETWIKTTAGNTDTGWAKSRAGSSFVRVLSETSPVLGDILGVFAGSYFTYFLKNNGDLYAAGENYSNQLGGAELFSSERETASLVLSDVKKAISGMYSYFGFAIKNDDTLWGTGYGGSGQWGNGTNDSLSAWTEITLDGDITGSGHVVDVACGEYFAAFLMSDNTLWGAGDDMGLGNTPVQIDTNVTAIAAGGYHLLYIKDDDTLWGVGSNDDGQLGTGDYNYHNYDDPVQIDTNVKAVGCGGYHSGYIKNDDTLWMIGANWDGQLGTGDDSERVTPVQISTNVKSVTGGDSHTLFIKNDDTLWGVGATYSGQLGLFTDYDTFEPVQIDTNVSTVSSGYDHSLYIKTDKTLYGMGYNYYYSLGEFFYETAMYSANATSGWTAVSHEYIDPNNSEDVSWNDLVYAEGKFVAGGGEGLTVIKYSTDGLVWQTASIENSGYGINGLAYGDGTFVAVNSPNVGQPEIYTSEDGITWNTSSIRDYVGDLYGVTYGNGLFIAGGNDRIIRSADGVSWLECTRSLYSSNTYRFAYGNNTYVAAADSGDYAADTNEYEITFDGGTASFISAADDSAFLISDGVLYACGDSYDGKLGMGDINRVVYFYPITSNVKTVAASNRHTTFVKNDGTLWGTGNNNYGQLGDGTYMRRFHPVQIDTNVSQSYGGDEFDSTIYIKNDGTLWGLGANSWSQIADSTVYGNTLTAPIQIDSNVKMASGGDNYIIYLKNDGTLWGRGYNGYGQLGLGDTSQRTSSVQIDSGVSYCVASNINSYYIKSDGSLYGMGYNGYGQLGLGDTSDRDTPTQITSSGVVQVAAGTEYSKYIDSTGRIYGAGNNADGALGIGNNSTQYTHTLATVSGSVQIACAYQTSYMIKSDGTVFSCGNNNDGLLGTNYIAETGTYSTDGVTWSSSYAPDFYYRDVAFGNGRFVMVADDPFAISSTDGINWTSSYVTTSSYVELSKITFDGTKFVTVANDTDNTFLNVFTSTDGISWTQARIGPDSYWSAVAYGDGKYVVLSSGTRDEVRPATALTI